MPCLKTEFDAVSHARQELLPLLNIIFSLKETKGWADQAYYFKNLQDGIIGAKNQGDLIEVFFNLSAANFMGFEYAMPVVTLLDQLLEKAELLSESQTVPFAEKH